jgi:hypothetical protein
MLTAITFVLVDVKVQLPTTSDNKAGVLKLNCAAGTAVPVRPTLPLAEEKVPVNEAPAR